MTIELKQALFHLCQEQVDQKIQLAQKGIKDAQNAANNETKSSAGDKYETGRAMMHLEKQRQRRQRIFALMDDAAIVLRCFIHILYEIHLEILTF